jgi:hypothetical protein
MSDLVAAYFEKMAELHQIEQKIVGKGNKYGVISFDEFNILSGGLLGADGSWLAPRRQPDDNHERFRQNVINLAQQAATGADIVCVRKPEDPRPILGVLPASGLGTDYDERFSIRSSTPRIWEGPTSNVGYGRIGQLYGIVFELLVPKRLGQEPELKKQEVSVGSYVYRGGIFDPTTKREYTKGQVITSTVAIGRKAVEEELRAREIEYLDDFDLAVANSDLSSVQALTRR